MRHLIVLDTETSGLDPARDVVVEVAWRDTTTGDEGLFVPAHDPVWVQEHGDPRALAVNGYRDRLATAPQDYTGTETARLASVLEGNTIAGFSPAFDAGFLTALYRADAWRVTPPRWHHRLLDLTCYAAGVLGLHPATLPGRADVCRQLGVEESGPHTAAGDRDDATECLRRLTDIALYPRRWVSDPNIAAELGVLDTTERTVPWTGKAGEARA